MDWVVGGVGVLALVVTALGFCAPSDAWLRRLNLVGIVLWMGHFALLGVWVAVATLALAGVLVLATIRGWSRIGAAALLANVGGVVLVVVLVAVGWSSPSAVLPAIGGLLMNVGVARFEGRALTVCVAAGTLAWLATGVVAGSMPVVVANGLNLVALLVRVARTGRGAR